jgi:hypothetical protein
VHKENTMAYQRWGKPGRYYIWMGVKGVHVGDVENGCQPFLTHDVAGTDNAAALLRACNDILTAEGFDVTIKKGEVKIAKKK